jgi:hypothetical protein
MDERDGQADSGQGNPPAPQDGKPDEPTPPTSELQSASGVLDPEVKARFAPHANRIRKRAGRRFTHDVAIGRELLDVKNKIDRGQWLPWLAVEFNWSERHAQRLMNLARFDPDTVSDLERVQDHIAPTAYYTLALPSTPPEVLKQVIDLAGRGQYVTKDDVVTLAETNPQQSDADLDTGAILYTFPSKDTPQTRNQLSPRKRCTRRHETLDRAASKLEWAADKLTDQRDKRYLADQIHNTIAKLGRLEAQLRSAGSS